MMEKLRFIFLFFVSLIVCYVKADETLGIIEDRIYRRNIQYPSDSLVEDAINRMGDDGGYVDVDYTGSVNVQWDAMRHLSRISDIVYSYTTFGSGYYGKEEALNKIIHGLQYWYNKNPKCNNWWYNYIGEPQKMGIILVTMERGCTCLPTELKNLLICRMAEQGGNPKDYSGANRTDIALHWLYRACLTKDRDLLKQSLDFLYEPIKYSLEEGIQVDGSFFQHGQQLYLGGYADRFLTSVLDVCEYTTGTEFELSHEKLDILRFFF